MNVITSSGLGSTQISPIANRPTAMFSEAQIISRILEFTGYPIVADAQTQTGAHDLAGTAACGDCCPK